MSHSSVMHQGHGTVFTDLVMFQSLYFLVRAT